MCVGIVGVRKSAGIVVVQKFARVGVLPCVRSVRVQANRVCRLIAVRAESACAG